MRRRMHRAPQQRGQFVTHRIAHAHAAPWHHRSAPAPTIIHRGYISALTTTHRQNSNVFKIPRLLARADVTRYTDTDYTSRLNVTLHLTADIVPLYQYQSLYHKHITHHQQIVTKQLLRTPRYIAYVHNTTFAIQVLNTRKFIIYLNKCN